jgi:hypothetical protein
MCSGALRSDQYGRLVVTVTVGDTRTPIGKVFVVVSLFEVGFTPPGRKPSARERDVTAKHFYTSAARYHQQQRERVEIPDEELDDAEAIRQTMLEQRREPVDLIGTVAA